MAGPGTTAGVRNCPIVFVHGDFADGWEAWGPVLAAIGPRYRTIVVDRPGFGNDLPDATTYTIAGDARYVLAATEELGLETFHLVGHSYGGLVAIEMAALAPGSARSLHLIEPPLLDLLPEDPHARDLDARARAIQTAYCEGEEEATTEAFFTAIGSAPAVERLRGTFEWRRLCAHAARFARSESAGAFPCARVQDLPAGLPVAVYSGGRSHPALRAVAAELAACIDQAQFTDVPDAGHAVQMAGPAFLEPMLKLIQDTDARFA